MDNRNRDVDLWNACEKEELPKVQVLLALGGNPCRMISGKKWAAIHRAVCYDNFSTDILKAMISSGRISNIDVKNLNGNTPLLLACGIGNISCARMLLRNGASVTLKDAYGSPAIYYAAHSSNPAMVEECLKWYGVDVNQRGRDNKTALMKACEEGHTDVVPALLSSGADVNMKDSNGYSAFWYARESKDISELLVKNWESTRTDVGFSAEAMLPTAFGNLHISSSNTANQNIAYLKSIIIKVFPNFPEDRIKSLIGTIESAGVDFNTSIERQLLFLESVDFLGVLKPVETRMLTKEFKDCGNSKAAGNIVVNF